MVDKCEEALDLVREKSRADFDEDHALRLAVAHLIQVIGEAARRVCQAYQVNHPDVPWREIVGMRHKIVHDYMDVDFDVVWSVVQTDLPDLVKILRDLQR